MNMRILIPTRSRVNQQLTLSWLSPELRKNTSLVCPKKDQNALTATFENVEVVVQPDPDWKIGTKRKWMMEEWNRRGYDKIIMLDDDLRFATRISIDDWHLREIKGQELIGEFKLIEDKMGEEFPHVGFGCRQGNNTLETPGWKIPCRMIYALGYYLPIVLKEVELGRLHTREDMDITLQLLRKGYPNAVWQNTVVDQRAFGAPGGATTERTIEISNADAYRLSEYHPGYVRVTNKEYKSSIPRFEVVCEWKKALEDGLLKKRQMSLF